MAKDGVYYRNGRDGIAWIRFKDEAGEVHRETTRQSDREVARKIRAKRMSEVAMLVHFPMRGFGSTTFAESLDYWWKNHGKNTRSKFEYRLRRVRERCISKRARDIKSDPIRSFMSDLEKAGLAASSINQCRTILCSIFSFAIKNEKYDKNPVLAVPEREEPPGRDRFATPEEINALLDKCDAEGDKELRASILVAATTGARKGEQLPRPWADMKLDAPIPHMYIPKTKNGRAKYLPLPDMTVEALKALHSFGHHDYVYPAKPNVRFKGDFSKPYAWDVGKRFRRICRLAGVRNLRIHDFRHFAASTLFSFDIPKDRISKLTGHRSAELERYIHMSLAFKKQTVDLIAEELKKAHVVTQQPRKAATALSNALEVVEKNGGDDGVRTRDLRRDRPAF